LQPNALLFFLRWPWHNQPRRKNLFHGAPSIVN
jgi:hypothetical protein